LVVVDERHQYFVGETFCAGQTMYTDYWVDATGFGSG